MRAPRRGGGFWANVTLMCFPASSAAVRVLVVDDSLPFRQATRELIHGTEGFECIGDANSGEAAVEQASRLEPDLVLMDVRMPGIGGIEAARRIGDPLDDEAPSTTFALETLPSFPANRRALIKVSCNR